ncbi:Membralin [Trinorchestia longiramus]|nr:Membralin [Trinorchestia longiramus]
MAWNGGDIEKFEVVQNRLTPTATAAPTQGTSAVFTSHELCTEIKGATGGSFNISGKKRDKEKSFGSAAAQIPDSKSGSTESTVCGAHGSVCRSTGSVGGNYHDGSDAHGSSHGGPTTVNSVTVRDPASENETHLDKNPKFIPVTGESSKEQLLVADNVSAKSSCSSDYCGSPLGNNSDNGVSISTKINSSCIPSPNSSIGNGTHAHGCIENFPLPATGDTELLSTLVDSSLGSGNDPLPLENHSELSTMNTTPDTKVSESSKVPLVNEKTNSTVSILSSNVDTEIRASSNSSAQPSSSEQSSVHNRPATIEQGTSTDVPQQTSDLNNSASNMSAPSDAAAPQQAQQTEADTEAHNAAGFPNVRVAVPTNLNQLRERMFRSLFLRASVAYARSTTPFIRRLLEFILLIKSLGCLFLLILVHLYLCNQSPACLPAGTEWDKTGILRVEVIPSPDPSYSLARSYQKEELLHRRYTMDGGTIIFTAMEEFNKVSDAVLLDETIMPNWKVDSTSKPYAVTSESRDVASETEELSELSWSEHVSASVREMSSPFFSPFAMGVLRLFYDGAQLPHGGATNASSASAAPSCPAAEAPNPLLPPTTCPALPDFLPMQEEEEVYFYMPEDAFIMEYALDYGLLRLSGATRKRLGVPVTLVVLDPNTNPCFGDSFSTFLLSNLVGYDELLLAAVKTLAENDGGKGYLRNVVTGEHYRFVSTWLGGTNYVGAALVMVVFTLSVSLLLRYSHHQIFLFIVHLLHMMEINATAMASFPAAPMLTVILALVGMEAIMSEFFKDTTTAFYIIVMVWVCDQYETLCCTQPITRKHWLRFFYLYHFAFYAYHYRFNGQYSWLALMTSWFFLQHSMLYFYHHYEMPAMLRSRPRLQAVNIVMRRPTGDPAPGPGSTGNSTGTAESSAGTAGSSAGTAGSSAGTAGSSAGTAGSSAGTAGSSAGTAGSSAGTAGSSAGTAGSSAGTAGSSAGTAGSSAGTAESSTSTPSRNSTTGNGIRTSGNSLATPGSSGYNTGVPASSQATFTTFGNGICVSTSNTVPSGTPGSSTVTPGVSGNSNTATPVERVVRSVMYRVPDHKTTSMFADPVENEALPISTTLLSSSKPVVESGTTVPCEPPSQNFGPFTVPTPVADKTNIYKSEGINSDARSTYLSNGTILRKPDASCTAPSLRSMTPDSLGRDRDKPKGQDFYSSSAEIGAGTRPSVVTPLISPGQPRESVCDGAALPTDGRGSPNKECYFVLDSSVQAAVTGNSTCSSEERVSSSNGVTSATPVCSLPKSDAILLPCIDPIPTVSPATAVGTVTCPVSDGVEVISPHFNTMTASAASALTASSACYSRR